MSDDDTLNTLVRVCRGYRVTERRLCCPACGDEVVLRDGLLWCVCGEAWKLLADLAVKR